MHLKAGGHQHLALVAAPVPAGGRIILATQGDRVSSTSTRPASRARP
jgi:hypothetical protein